MVPAFLSEVVTAPVLLEGVMLTCFGLAWPVANLRMMRTGRAEGKGLSFTLIIFFGYLAGAAAKIVLSTGAAALAPVFWLYALNATSVGLNLFLQWHLGRQNRANLVATSTPAIVM
ncbi:MAG: hypothetical protein WCH35_17280 [Comamonadaceae bacterium]